MSKKKKRKELLFNSHPFKQGEGSDGDGKRVDVPLQIFPPPPPPFPLFVYFLLAPMTTPASVAAARVGKPVR